LVLSGGEFLSDPIHVQAVLRKIAQRRANGRLHIDTLGVQSNGVFIHNYENGPLGEILQELVGFGVNQLEVSGFSGYHLEQLYSDVNEGVSDAVQAAFRAQYSTGLRTKLVSLGLEVQERFTGRKIENFEGNRGGMLFGAGLTVILRGSNGQYGRVVPLGRGKQIRTDRWKIGCLTAAEALKQRTASYQEKRLPVRTITVAPSGEAYWCCYSTLPFGNVLEASLGALLEGGEISPDTRELVRFYRALDEKRPVELPKLSCSICGERKAA
jgi:hypothetical protein